MKYVLMFFAFGALLSAGPVNVTLVSVSDAANNNQPVSDGSVYVSPYTISVNGTNYTALCVDDQDWTNQGAKWTANLTQVGSSSLANTFNPGEQTEYEEAAYLFTLITKASGTSQINIQHAVWDIIDHSITSSTSLSNPKLNLIPGDTTYIQEAQANYNKAGLNFNNFDIVTSVNCPREQEFLICSNTPEPASFALLGVGLLMAGATRAWRRRKQVNAA
ncbi:MAG: PEP-CTERM sorting domain-containing protein [Acidobacteriaceae bacterium]|nr:PEP-CTERM sorting domain-containing protein [Acidobacteriaceae bacterium]MBV9781171.1 PEP-CTERM sorting domain-containing protein [Acidobacteriaceae bacterium]